MSSLLIKSFKSDINNDIYLHFTAELDSLLQLLGSGVDDNSVHGLYRRTALHLAADQGHSYVVVCFLTAGAAVNVVDRKNNNALHYASMRSHESVRCS